MESSISGSFLADSPIRHSADDLLDRASFARTVSQSLTPPGERGVVVGVYGPWGEGKTSVLNFVEEALRKGSVHVLRFDPWSYGDKAAMLGGFLDLLAEASVLLYEAEQRSPEKKPRWDRRVRAKIKRLWLRHKGRKLARSLGSRFMALSGVHWTMKAAGNLLSGLGGSIEEYREHVSRQLAEIQGRIVLIVDDVDRLPSDELQSLFRALMTIGRLENVSYLLALDPKIVGSALEQVFPDSSEGGSGERFLEKVVQVPLELPNARPEHLRAILDRELRKSLESLPFELDATRLEQFWESYPNTIGRLASSVRQIRRFVNTVVGRIATIREEVHLADFLLLEAMREWTPDLYKAVIADLDLFVGLGPSTDAEIAAGRSAFEQWADARSRIEVQVGRELLRRLFPGSGAFLGGTRYAADSLGRWRAERRVCFSGHTHRYLSLSLEDSSLPSAQFLSLCELAGEQGRREDLEESIAGLLRTGKCIPLANELHDRVGGLNDSQLAGLVEVTPAAAGAIQVSEVGIDPGSPGTQLAMAWLDLLGPGSVSIEVAAAALLNQRVPHWYQYEVLRWWAARIEREGKYGGLDDEGLKKLRDRKVERTVDIVDKRGVLGLGAGRGYLIQHLWEWADRRGVSEVTDAVLASRPNAREVLGEVLRGACPRWVGSSKDRDRPGSFGAGSVEQLAAIFDLERFADALRREFGGSRPDAKEATSFGEEFPSIAANQLLQLLQSAESGVE